MQGGKWAVEQGYIGAQDFAVKSWLRMQSTEVLGGSWQQVYESATDGSRRLGLSFGGLKGWRGANDFGGAQFGNYFSLERPLSSMDAIEGSALAWSNQAKELYDVTARPGFYFKGVTAPQYSDRLGRLLDGGNTQIFQTKVPTGISDVFDPTWNSTVKTKW